MPWCDACDRFLSPSTVKIDGTCPACGRVVDPGHAHLATDDTLPVDPHAASGPVVGTAADEDDEDLPPIPWHLWLLAGALAVYLGYRAMQGIEWLFGVVVTVHR